MSPPGFLPHDPVAISTGHSLEVRGESEVHGESRGRRFRAPVRSSSSCETGFFMRPGNPASVLIAVASSWVTATSLTGPDAVRTMARIIGTRNLVRRLRGYR